MATLSNTNRDNSKLVFRLELLRWERYYNLKVEPDLPLAKNGEPYTRWIIYRMALKIEDQILYESKKETTLILEDLEWLTEELKELVDKKRQELHFEPIEPDFNLRIKQCIEKSADYDEDGNEVPGTEKEVVLDYYQVILWIDHLNQAKGIYSGEGPGLVFYVEREELAEFREGLLSEKKRLGKY